MADEKKNNTDEEIEEQEAEDAGNGGAENSGSDDKDKSSDKGAKTFTQDQVTRMMTREKNQGRAAAYKELGIDPKDKKMVGMFKAFVESQKTDDQKAEDEKAANDQKAAEAERRANVAEAKAEAMMLGVKPQYVDDIVTLALAKMTEDSDLKTVIGEFKTKYPVWFGESSEEDDEKKDGKNSKNKTGQKGTGSSVKSDKEKNGNENKGLGARLAAQRKTGSKKSSYWGNK